jgi:hypothetical protein
MTFSRTSVLTYLSPFMVRETVIDETPAWRATSWIVTTFEARLRDEVRLSVLAN